MGSTTFLGLWGFNSLSREKANNGKRGGERGGEAGKKREGREGKEEEE